MAEDRKAGVVDEWNGVCGTMGECGAARAPGKMVCE